ncbi:thermonuclease family protein [Thermocrinis sp.]|uniref:thermonuclease family protein n=1 Tax=Thermocrinis sp. TaxID=2024383 RepID=UPI002FDD9E8F
MRALLFFSILFLLLSYSCSKDVQADKGEVKNKTPCRVVRVIDGDTFTCTLKNGEEIKVRMIGVDTPETRESPKLEKDVDRTGLSREEIIKMGEEAKEYTKKLLPKGEVVYLEQDVQPTDRYGRVLAYVWLKDGRMINELLVMEGMAQVYTIPPNVKYQERLLKAQKRAMQEGKGFWGTRRP